MLLRFLFPFSNIQRNSTVPLEVTEMSAMNNPVFISDEGMRNGYSYPNPAGVQYGAHVYPLLGTQQAASNQATLPGVRRYTSLDSQVNEGFREEDDLPPYRSREDDSLSYGNDFGSQNFINETLDRAEGQPKDQKDDQKNKRNSALRLGVQVFPISEEPPRYDRYVSTTQV